MNEYKQNGKLEDYVLGLLNEDESALVLQQCKAHPELMRELQALEKTLSQYLAQEAIPVVESEKQKLFETINLLESENFNDGTFPLIHKYSDSNAWMSVLREKIEAMPDRSFYAKTLRHDHKVEICVIKTHNNIPEEIHHDLRESFLLLQGSCTCLVGDSTYNLKAGDFLEIPLDADHNVIVTSKEPVIAILQRLAA